MPFFSSQSAATILRLRRPAVHIEFSRARAISLAHRNDATYKPAATKHEWLVVLPDKDGALQRRLELRPVHLQELSKYPPDFILCGGPYLRQPVEEGKSMEMIGSMLVAFARSAEEIREYLKSDIYTQNGVWDWEKAQIVPFSSTIRKQL